jgi:apolipoprotein D and lipocalin family protein
VHRVIAVLLLPLLVACAAPAPAPPQAGFRPAEAPIYSNAAFMPAQLIGRWRQAAAVTAAPDPGCAPGGAEFRAGPKGMTMAGQLCLNGRVTRVAGPVTPIGPGRFRLPVLGEAWVIWVDADNRTLAFATPSGAWGFVLDEGTISPDRLAAASEIFAFNGYRPGSLKPF